MAGVLLLSLLPALQASTETQVEELSDRRYLPKILELIAQAKTSIDVSLYQILLAGNDSAHPVAQILKALADARARGVRIRVLLNRFLDYTAGETIPLARSLAAHEYLTHSGIEVVFAHPSRRLHDKVIVIDERWVLEGSMNWTKTALLSNWESASLIDSPAYAAAKLARIRSIPASDEQTLDMPGDEGRLLEIPAALLTKEKYFPDMLEDKDERIFEFYLWLLAHFPSAQGTQLNDETLFRIFRLDPAKPQKDKRREAVRLLKKLKKQGLIDLKIPSAGADAEVTLLPISSVQKFKIPEAYFKENFSLRLSFAAEFVYLMARLEMAQSPSSPWWWRSQEDLTRIYHLHHTTLAAGMLELQRENVIEIFRDDAPEDAPHSERLVNRYRVNVLSNAAGRSEQRQRMAVKFGAENMERAARFADTMDEPNDPVVLATILKWMSTYPPGDLDRAFDQISRYERNNPRRSLYYIHGILEGMKKG